MVRGSLSEPEQRYWRRMLGAGFVGVVALSAGLIAFQGGASLVEIGLVMLAGTATGAVLLWYLLLMDVTEANTRHR